MQEYTKSQILNADYKKTNSFTNQLNIQQITSYFLVIFILLSFFLVLVPFIDGQNVRIVFFILTVATILALIIFTYVCSTNDPTDTIILKQKIAAYRNESFDVLQYKFYCEDCDAYVQDESKHCKRCDRCVHDFDHHCKWINNCIGVTNYRSFVGMIVSLLAFIIVQLVVCVYAIITHVNDKIIDLENTTFINIYDLEKPQDKTVLLVFLYINTLFCILILFLDFNLVMLHLFLFFKKMTTYQYIIYTREQNAIKKTELDRKNYKKRQEKKQKQQEKDKKEQEQLQKQVEKLNKQKEQQQHQLQGSVDVTQIKNQIIPIENYNFEDVQQKSDENKIQIKSDNATSQQNKENIRNEELEHVPELFRHKPERLQSALEKFQKSIDSNSSFYQNFKERYLSYSLMLTNDDILKIKQPKEKINSESAYQFNNIQKQNHKSIDLNNKTQLHQNSNPNLGKNHQETKSSLFQQQLSQHHQQQQKYKQNKIKSDRKKQEKQELESLDEIESKVFEQSMDQQQTKDLKFKK